MKRAGRRWVLGVVGVCVCMLLCSGTSYGGSKNKELQTAVRWGDLVKARELIEKGANVNYMGRSVDTLLHTAAENGYKEIVELLIANGAEVNARTKYNGETPLYIAAEECHKYVAELLIANGADVNAKTSGKTGWAPLHAAAASTCSHYGVLALLIANGADVNARDNDGSTPLHCAAAIGLPYAVELLIANGADINARDDNGRTPYQNALSRKYIAELLRRYGGK